MFFCKLGKDRTGLMAALVLSACGVSEDDIVADYVRCGVVCAPEVACWGAGLGEGTALAFLQLASQLR